MENYFLVGQGGLLGLGYSLIQNQLIPLVFFALEDGGGGGGVLSLANQFGFDLQGGGVHRIFD
jgi:hypothetical protein